MVQAVSLKATNKRESSDAIVVSFKSRWLSPLRSQKVQHVFRKRGPSGSELRTIVVYVGVPVSSVVGALSVESHTVMPVPSALKLASRGGLSQEQLAAYAQGYDSLHVFGVGQFVELDSHWSLGHLQERFGFYPPQSFMRLSLKGRDLLLNHDAPREG